MHGASTARRNAAAEFGAGQSQFIADDPEQRRFGLDIEPMRFAVDGEGDHGVSQGALICAAAVGASNRAAWISNTNTAPGPVTSQPVVFTKYILTGATLIALQHETRVPPRAHGQHAGNALDWRGQAGHSPRPAGNLPIMTQATELLGASRASHFRIVGVISAAHFVSHYYIIILAPLLPFVRSEYGVSYTEIGLALAAFNVVSAALQTPAGFLVDWLGARVLLVVGLLIEASAFVIAGLVDSFWVMVAMFALAGVGNTVYHPADYALLSHHVPPDRIGQAFSVHTFAGMLGSAVAPASLLVMQNLWGWRGAFIGAGMLGFAVAAILLAVRDDAVAPVPAAPARAGADKPADGWRLLLSAPILLNLFFFILIALMSGGMYNYSVVALGALYGTPVAVANTALSCL